MRRLALALSLAALGTAILGTASAGAATVSYSVGSAFSDNTGDTSGCSHAMMCGTAYTVVVTAAPGEVNQLRITSTGSSPGTEIVIQDAGASPSVAPGSESDCRVTAPDEVRCKIGPPHDAGVLSIGTTVMAGDRDDQVTLTGLDGRADGGDGDDTITASGVRPFRASGDAGSDRLTGGDSSDTLVGGAGPDTLAGGAGNDSLDGDGPGAPPGDDVIGGGPGTDGVTYSDRTDPVTIDLAAGSAGQSGERDVLSEVEQATGGRGADSVSGDNGPNRLAGGPGPAGRSTAADRLAGLAGDDQLTGSPAADTLDGGDGKDHLTGGRGDDTYLGGAGDDSVDLADGDRRARTRASCGPDSDRVIWPEASTLVDGDCETAEFPNGLLLSLARAGRTIEVKAAAAAFPPDDCGIRSARIKLLRGSRLVATANLARLSRRTRRARVTLTRYGRRSLGGGAQLRLTVAIKAVSRCSPRRGLEPAGGYQAGLSASP